MKRLSAFVFLLLFLFSCAQAQTVALAPNVEREMLSANYWIDRMDAPDEVLLTGAQIAALNEARGAMIGFETADGAVRRMALEDVQNTLDGAAVRALINANEIPQTPRYLNGQRVDAAYFERLDAQRNLSAVTEIMPVRFGFSVQRADMKGFPSDDFVTDDPNDPFFNLLSQAELMPLTPLAVLHESADGEWYYVLVYAYGGWVRKENVALCQSREEWLARQQTNDFLTVTEPSLRLDFDAVEPRVSALEFPMGVRLPLAQNPPAYVNGRSTYGSYVVSLPVRTEDGQLQDALALVPVSAGVCEGFLPYTRANVLRLAFQFLGREYGWCNTFDSVDCSGLTGAIYRCFGLIIPRGSSAQSVMPGYRRIQINAGMGENDRQALLSTLSPGALLSFPGHIMLYIGTVDGNAYIIHSMGSWVSQKTGKKERVQCVVVSDLKNKRGNGKTWCMSLTNINTMLPE